MQSNVVDVETLAKALYEDVPMGPGGQVLPPGWDGVDDRVRNRFREAAARLMERFDIMPKASVDGDPEPPPHITGEIEPPAK